MLYHGLMKSCLLTKSSIMFTFSEPLQKPWTFACGQKHISISKDIAIKLQNPDIIAINFLYQTYCDKFTGCILNEEDGFKTQLQVSAFLNVLKQALPIKQQISILIITPGYLIEKWQNKLENIAGNKVKIVNSTTCPTDFGQESDVAFLLSFEDIKLAETLAQNHFTSIVIDHFDVVVSKRVIKRVGGDFNIGITRRNFYKNPDQKLQWTMLNWANPMSVGKLVDFYEADNDNFANLRDNYHRWWLTLTWEYCESFKRNIDEDDESQSPQSVITTKRTYKKRKRKSSSNVPKKEKAVSSIKDEENSVKVDSTNEIETKISNVPKKEKAVSSIKDEENSVKVDSTNEIETKTYIKDYSETQIENDSSDSQDTIEYVPENKSDINCSKTENSDDCNVLMDIIEGTSTQTYLENSDHKSQVDLKKEELYSQLFNDNPFTNTNTDNSSKDYLLSLI